MHKHHMNFTDFNGNPREIDLYFNLTEAELTKMQIASKFGLQKDLEEALKNEDNQRLLDFMEYLVHHAYGIKSEDGMEFQKSEAIMQKFENSAYYSDLYMSLFQEEGQAGVRFINALMPAELIRRAEANAKGEGELAQAAAAATALKPDSRTLFEQSRSQLQDHKPAVVGSTEVPTTNAATVDQQSAEFLAWKEQQARLQIQDVGKTADSVVIDNSEPLTRAQYAVKLAEQGVIVGNVPNA